MHVDNDFPLFPNFRKLDIDSDKDTYNSFYKQFPIYADFSFGNLFIWINLNNDLKVAQLENGLIYQCTNPLENNQQTITILGNSFTNHSLDKLFDYQRNSGIQPKLSEVPEFVTETININKYKITENRDSFEYLLSTHEHSELAGHSFSKLRRKVGCFRRLHEPANITWEICDKLTNEKVKQLSQLVNSWGLSYHDATESNEYIEYNNFEDKVIQKTLSYFNKLDMALLMVYLDDKPIAFVTYQFLPQKGYVTINHFKVNYNIKYAFDFTTHVLATELHLAGIHTMNFEQDLGIPGLRAHKERLRPIDMLRKIDIEPKVT